MSFNVRDEVSRRKGAGEGYRNQLMPSRKPHLLFKAAPLIAPECSIVAFHRCQFHPRLAQRLGQSDEHANDSGAEPLAVQIVGHGYAEFGTPACRVTSPEEKTLIRIEPKRL